ncbi:MAG: hypothetical protein R3330_01180, partial [Saprospiraceae bacterium]|nr:hypothetical protein [Saprospiraceae bacterium]
PEELAFVRRSIADVRRKRRARQITIAAIMLILGATTVWALYAQREAKKATVEAERQLEQTILERQRAAEQRYRADLATYDQLIEKAVNLMDAEQPDYEGARELLLQAAEVANSYQDNPELDIDNNGERARRQAATAEERIPLKDRFNALMEEALRWESEGYHRYMDALRKYREALSLNYNNYSAEVSIEVLTNKFPIAFESLRKDGDVYFDLAKTVDDVNGWRMAEQRYRQALQIPPVAGVDREHVLKRLKECQAQRN